MKKLIHLFYKLLFLGVNMIGNFFLPNIKEKKLNDVVIRSYNKKYLADVKKLWNSLEEGCFGKRQKLLLTLFGKKTCFVMIKDDKLIGFIFFYFRFNDLINQRIHSAFGVIDLAYRKIGYGALLPIFAWDYFREIKFIHGISSRYSLDNNPSRRLHEKYGFKVLYKYYDKHLQKDRVYVVCKWK